MTPGPWVVAKMSKLSIWIVSEAPELQKPGENEIAHMDGFYPEYEEEMLDNAHILAASLDMLAMLKKLFAETGEIRLKELIAKAERKA